MKLTALPIQESSVKVNLSVKQSTSDLLDSYAHCYKETYGHEVVMREMIETMLLDFMKTDKDFQVWRQDQAAQAPAGKKARKAVKVEQDEVVED